MCVGFLVFVADKLDQVGIEHDALVDSEGPQFGVGFWIVDSYVDLEVAEVRPPERSIIVPVWVSGLPCGSPSLSAEPMLKNWFGPITGAKPGCRPGGPIICRGTRGIY